MKDYKRILQGVVNIINITKKSDIGFANICSYIGENCPELKESEDRQHRKWILEYLYDGLRKSDEQFKGQFKSAIAWLEKQGDKDKLIKELGEYKVKYTQEVLKEHIDSMNNKEDDRIRKEIIDFIYDKTDTYELREKSNSWLAWLEKQGEQNSTDKVEPKFNVGDWVVHDMSDGRVSPPTQIVDMTNKSYVFDTEECFYFSDAEEAFRKWTIRDAKNGDVLSYRNGQWIFIYKEKTDDSTFSYYTLYSTIHQDLTINDSGFTLLSDAIIPSTKEQRDLLFTKMKEVGYKWDAEKKELKKIEQKPIIPKFKVGDVIKDTEDGEVFTIKTITKEKYIYTDGSFDWIKDQDVYELVEQNLRMIQWKGDNLKEVIDFTGKDKNFDKWFKSFEEYEKFVREHEGILKLFNEDGSHYEVPVGAWIVKTPDGRNVASKAVFKQKPTWSEDDKEMFRFAIEHFEIQKRNSIEGGLRKKSMQEFIDWFKDLKNRVLPQPKQEWSEEDKMHIHSIISTIECCRKENEQSKVIADCYTSDLEWFKSLMNRCKPSEDLPHWKKGTLKGKNVTGFNSDFFSHNGYYINYKELFDKLPKDE